MKRIDWYPEETKRAAELEEQVKRDPTLLLLPKKLPYEHLPADVRAMLEDPERPRVMHRSETYYYGDGRSIAGVIRGEAEYSKHDINVNDRSASVAEKTARAEWQRRQLQVLGYAVGPAVEQRPLYNGRDDNGYFNRYTGMVDAAISDFLRAEAEASAQLAAAEDEDEERDEQLAVIPDEGADVVAISAAWGKSATATRRDLDRLVAAGAVRFEKVPSARGGKPKKTYFRAASGAQ